MMGAVRVAAAAAALSILAGCGGNGGGGEARNDDTTSSTPSTSALGSPTTSTSSTAPGGPAPGGGPTSSIGPSPGGPGTTAAPGDNGTPPSSQPPPSDFPIRISFTSPCANPGSKQTIKFETEPSASLAYVIQFADGSGSQDATYGGVADSRGRWEHTFTVPAAAPRGTATAHVSGQSGKRNAYAKHGFTVGC